MHLTIPFTLPFVAQRGLRALLSLMFVAALLSGIAPSARAQGSEVRATSTDQVKFPNGLRWETMREVVYWYTPTKQKESQSPKDAAQADAVWADEIRKAERQNPAVNLFVLLANATTSTGVSLTFSLLNLLDFERCERPMGGRSSVDQYSKCLARVAVSSQQKSHVVEFVGFCHLNIVGSTDNPNEKNHTEFAFDSRTNTGYFRVIQYGKEVSACRRAIHLEGV
ncbi:hypothetical protein [Hydrogenophaga sp. NFH-34]|uniref:hypothetical protein n=1 Tax=Hydrogenophaga sp. NFH-34 TaxID=2744446 RepID=UPI001F3D357F|nr:hypothetical protein [Hydrogenophaga sp. NFH-34]